MSSSTVRHVFRVLLLSLLLMFWQGIGDLMLWKYHVAKDDAIAILAGQLSMLFVIFFGLYRLMRLEGRKPWRVERDIRSHLMLISGRIQIGDYDGALNAARACAMLLQSDDHPPHT